MSQAYIGMPFPLKLNNQKEKLKILAIPLRTWKALHNSRKGVGKKAKAALLKPFGISEDTRK